MEVIENEIEFQPEEGKLNLNLEGAKTFKEKFKQSILIFSEGNESASSMHKSFNKMKIQIGFLVYNGLIMLSYGCNKYYDTIPLLSQMSYLLSKNEISWKLYIKKNLEKYISEYKKIIIGGKVSSLSGAKVIMEYPCEYNKKKGEYFFNLWCRHIIIRKVAYIIKNYQEAYRDNPTKSMLRMRTSTNKNEAVILKEGLEHFYETKSYSLFQY